MNEETKYLITITGYIFYCVAVFLGVPGVIFSWGLSIGGYDTWVIINVLLLFYFIPIIFGMILVIYTKKIKNMMEKHK